MIECCSLVDRQKIRNDLKLIKRSPVEYVTLSLTGLATIDWRRGPAFPSSDCPVFFTSMYWVRGIFLRTSVGDVLTLTALYGDVQCWYV